MLDNKKQTIDNYDYIRKAFLKSFDFKYPKHKSLKERFIGWKEKRKEEKEDKLRRKVIQNYEQTHFSKNNEKKADKNKDEVAYCLVIPFHTKEDLKECAELVLGKREDISSKYWFGDCITIEAEDYKKLLEKSKMLEVIDSL